MPHMLDQVFELGDHIIYIHLRRVSLISGLNILFTSLLYITPAFLRLKGIIRVIK